MGGAAGVIGSLGVQSNPFEDESALATSCNCGFLGDLLESQDFGAVRGSHECVSWCGTACPDWVVYCRALSKILLLFLGIALLCRMTTSCRVSLE